MAAARGPPAGLGVGEGPDQAAATAPTQAAATDGEAEALEVLQGLLGNQLEQAKRAAAGGRARKPSATATAAAATVGFMQRGPKDAGASKEEEDEDQPSHGGSGDSA